MWGFGFFGFFGFFRVVGEGGGVGVVEVAWGVGLSVGGGSAGVSGDADLNGGGDDGLGDGGVNGGFLADSPGFVESSGKTSQTVSYSFSISAAMCFWSAWKGEVVHVVEVLTDKCVEVWENLRLDPYSNEGLLSLSEMRSGGGRGHEVMLVGWSIYDSWEWFAFTSGSVETATFCYWLNSKMLLVL